MRRISKIVLVAAILLSAVGCQKSWRECSYKIKCEFETKVEVDGYMQTVQTDSENLVTYVYNTRSTEWLPLDWDQVRSGKLGKESSTETLSPDLTFPQAGSDTVRIEKITAATVTIMVVDEPNKMFAWRTDEVSENMPHMPYVYMQLMLKKWKAPTKTEDLTNGMYHYTESKWQVFNADPDLSGIKGESEEP